MADQQLRNLETTLAALHERWGSRAVRKLGESSGAIPHLATSWPMLDRALGIGGLPRGHLSELVGAPTSGVNTLALKVIASAHQAGEMAAYFDFTGTFDADYAVRCGVQITNLLLVRPASEAEALDIAIALVRSHSLGALVYDATATPPTESLWRRLSAPLTESACAFLCMSREQSRLSPMVRLQLARERWLYRRREVQGYRSRVTIRENKFSALRHPVVITIGFSGMVAGDGA